MAAVTTITTPTAQEVSPGCYSISVTATVVDGATTLGVNTFSTSTTDTGVAGRNFVSAELANQIIVWRASLIRIQGAASLLAALKTNIEGRL